MTERALIRRELARQAALLFCVFALLFTLLGAGIYSMVSANIFRTADESLRSVEASMALATPADAPLAVEDSSSATATADEAAAVATGTAAELPLAIQQDIVDADPQFITLMRDTQGRLVDTVGLYASYPAYFAEIPFDAGAIDEVRDVEAGGHRYRAMAFSLGETGAEGYLQVLANVDAEIAILEGFTRTLVLYLVVAFAVAAAASLLLSRRMLKPIVKNWRAQTEFVQNASHELRTPLAVMQATGELLLDHPNDRIVDRFEDVNAIASETRRLARLVDDLMALSTGDAGRAALTACAVDMDALVRDAASAYEEFAALQGKRLAVDAAFGGTVRADPDKLRQLLGILLDNALKYTEPGDLVEVRTRAEGPRYVVEVADTGCGVSAEDRAHAFERFYRADKARSRETGGHGLGLALAKGIVEAHGGTIALKDNVPRGTVAAVSLPR